MRSRQSLLQPYIPQTGTQVPWKVQLLEAGVQGLWSNPRARAAVDCGGTDGGDLREETVVGNAWEGKLAPRKQGNNCWVSCRGGAITIASVFPQDSISSWTAERLAHQRPDALSYRVDPTQGGLSMCLTRQTPERDLREGSPLSSWMGGVTEEDRPKRPSERQLAEARGKTPIGP